MDERITWMIHYVIDDTLPNSTYTDGLNEYDSLELEMTLPLCPEIAGRILNAIGLDIVEGKQYKSGDHSTDYLEGGYPIYFLETISVLCNDSGKDKILRVIIPDIHYKFPWDKDCADSYKKQLNGVEILEMKRALSEK